jgi:hypothetical protein
MDPFLRVLGQTEPMALRILTLSLL